MFNYTKERFSDKVTTGRVLVKLLVMKIVNQVRVKSSPGLEYYQQRHRDTHWAGWQ